MHLKSIVKYRSPTVAIIGAGLMGEWHAHTARRLGAEVLAVIDPDQNRAVAISGSGGEVFSDSVSLFNALKPDIVHLCSPTRSHVPIIRNAISHGVHVFAEKPLAADAVETRAVYDAAQSARVLLCPVHQYAFQSAVDQVIQRKNQIGSLELVELRFYSAGGADADPADVPSILGDILPHPISIIQRFWPYSPVEVMDWKFAPVGSAGWELSSNNSQTTLRITLSLALRPTEATLEISGDKGALEVDLFHGFARFRDGVANRRTKALRPFSDAFSLVGHASRNLASRAMRREPAYPGLRALTSMFYAAVAGQGEVPIRADQAVSVALLRDKFLSHTVSTEVKV